MKKTLPDINPETIRILLVEDDPNIRRIISRTISHYGYTVMEAKDGREAIEFLEKDKPDIIVCDYMLPHRNGVEICHYVKNTLEYQGIFFIAVTAAADKSVEEALFEAGADEFIPKPIDPRILGLRLRAAARIVQRTQHREEAYRIMFRELDVLLIQDGGCAPGYNPVTAFLVHDLERVGRAVYCAKLGFKSVVSGKSDDYVRMVYHDHILESTEGIPGVFDCRWLCDAPGAQFRCERFKEFKEDEYVRKAAENIRARKTKVIIGIGGNGTFFGMKDLAKYLDGVQLAFIPVTVDSDVCNTDTIGQFTGVEVGAAKLHNYLADARTHKRVYVIELMGARGGYHALFSSIGARAHLAVLPGMTIDYAKVQEAINKRTGAVVAVAEGWEHGNPERGTMNAAEFFAKKLAESGVASNKRIIAEPFSRDLRGAMPNYQDIALAQRFSAGTVKELRKGSTNFMWAVEGTEHPIAFDDIRTDNTVSPDLAALANRIGKDCIVSFHG